ncbi:hypothetical protein FRC12_013684, partial [Ceratobasidium sp. 428]
MSPPLGLHLKAGLVSNPAELQTPTTYSLFHHCNTRLISYTLDKARSFPTNQHEISINLPSLDMPLTLNSTIKLRSGASMPLLGFGVYQNYDARTSSLIAFKYGYRHIDSAQMYRNEDAVGKAVKESGLKREDVFVTTKCASRDHGYEKTLAGVDGSLTKFGFDYVDLFLIHDPLSGPKKRLETYQALLESRDKGKIKS